MKRIQLLVASLALLASEVALATRVLGTPTNGRLPWDDGAALLPIAAAGLALGIWIVRRKKDK